MNNRILAVLAVAMLCSCSARGALPLVFEENRGQADPNVRFTARRGSIGVAIEPSAFTLAAPNGEWIRFSFEAANDRAAVHGENRQRETRNYFIGNDPSRWVRDVPTWERVATEELYPGIDLIFRAAGENLEYDFIVKPGANPAVIRMIAEGSLSLGNEGGALVASSGGRAVFRHLAPHSCQRGGAPVVSAWLQRGKEAGFALGTYDRSAELIIDPVIVTSTYMGGSSGDEVHALAVDAAGNIYLGGETYSTNYPVASAVQPINKTPSQRDGFVTKLDPSGRTVLFSTYFGGNGYDIVEALAVDDEGSLYFAGSGYSLDLPVSANAFQRQANAFSGEDGFVVKLTPAGNAIAYCTYLVANSNRPSFETLRGLAVDSAGFAYVVGDTTDPTWPVTPGAYRTTGCGGEGRDPFVTKVSRDGSSLVYSTYVCGSDFDLGNGIRVDASGNAFVVGTTFSADFPQAGTPVVAVRENDAWVAKLNPTGSSLLRSAIIGGSHNESGLAIALGGYEDLYIAGWTDSSDFPVREGYQQSYRGSRDSCSDGFCGDSFVVRLDVNLAILSATYVGGGVSDDRIEAIAASAAGVAVAGTTESTDFPLMAPTQSSYGGERDAFIALFDTTLRSLAFSTFIGGSDWDIGEGVTIGADGVVNAAGYTLSSNFPTSNAYQTAAPGSFDGFVVQFSGASSAPSPRRRAVRR
jgi:hypothetical protein